MDLHPRKVDGEASSSHQSQPQGKRTGRPTVAERLLQTLPNQGSSHYLNPQHSFSHQQEFSNVHYSQNTRGVAFGRGFRPYEYERGRQVPQFSGNRVVKQVAFATASASVSRSGFDTPNPHDPHPIDPNFMPNTMSRIAKVAGRPIANFYSTQASDPPKTIHVPSKRPNSRIRFDLPGEMDQDEITPPSVNNLSGPDAARENLKKLRQWERTTLGRLVGESGVYGTVGDGTRFTVVSYNVLAPSLLETHKYLYKECNPMALEWEYRLELFLKEITEYGADIVCLQEVEALHFVATYEPKMLQKGFKGVYKKRTREKEDGCAIFWKQNMFSLIGQLDVEYYQPHIPILDRDNVGVLVKLQSKIGRRPKLVVGTTHILYNPKRNDVKLAQVQLLLAEIDRFAFSGISKTGEAMYNHMILTGDFNADPYNSLIRFITDGELQYLSADGRRPTMLLKRGLDDFIPIYVGISDQCQHYKVILERFKMFRSSRKNVFEMDLNAQAPLVNLYYNDVNHYAVAPKASAVSASARRSASKISRPTTNLGTGNTTPNNFSNEVVDLAGEEDMETAVINNKDNLQTDDKKFHFDQRDHLRLMEEIFKSGTVCSFGSGELSHKLRFRSVYAPRLDRVDSPDGVATTRQNAWTCVDYMFYSMQWSDMQRRRVEGSLKLLRRLGLLTRNQCKQNGPLPSFAVPSDHYPLVAQFVLK